MARIQGLNQSVAERPAPARDDDLDPIRGDNDEQPYDELELYRLRRVGIDVDGGDYVDAEGRSRSKAELEREAPEALNG